LERSTFDETNIESPIFRGKAAAKEIGKIKKVNVAKKVAKKPPICLNCGIGGHNKPGFLCESIKNVIGLGDMQKQSNN
tara:strand:- start:8 stop:241 length:234 start_codon:yes stop_codon:yes gene_type:complete